ncbi:phosphoribosylamine--glycine ligase [Thermodesulfobacteriota bacterium]
MKILVVGSGGREHTLCWKLAQSSSVKKLYCAPGNPGTAKVAENVAIDGNDIGKLVHFAKTHDIDLVVVGPEDPLSIGLADVLEKEGVIVFGPCREAARMESSKRFAKQIMEAAGVPFAKYKEFTTKTEAADYCASLSTPIVIKANGLAAGKGVCVCLEESEVGKSLDFVYDELKSDLVLIEEYLEGVEASYIIAANNNKIVPMASSHDYKRLLDGQMGPNTGGMGSVSPTSHLTAEQEAWVLDHIMKPVLAALNNRGIPFKGFLYAGLMISPEGEISVVEFNVRMGDPECQSIIRRMEGDLAALLYGLATNSEVLPDIRWDDRTSVCIVASAEGYPGSVAKGDEIVGIDEAEQLDDIVVFYAGAGVDENDRLLTNGGRVLSVTSLGKNLSEAKQAAFSGLERVRFRGRHFRKDIGN